MGFNCEFNWKMQHATKTLHQLSYIFPNNQNFDTFTQNNKK